MRRVFVWLLLALLPWRLWAADAMALHPCGGAGHGAPALAAAVPQALHGHGHDAYPPDSMEGHAPHAASGAGDVSAQVDPHASQADTHAGCTLCDVCHNTAWLGSAPPALDVPVPPFWSTTQARVPPAPAPGPLLKPPIA